MSNSILVDEPAKTPDRSYDATGGRNWETLSKEMLPIAVLFVVFTILNRYFLAPWQLSSASYERSFILIGTFSELIRPNSRSLLVAGVCCFLLVHVRQWSVCWSDVCEDSRIRVIVVVCATLLSWIYSTYDYNHYFSQSHALDRVILVLCGVAIFWRPVFVFPFLLILWPLIGQFGQPLGGYSWAIPFLPSRILLLFSSSLLLFFVKNEWRATGFQFLMLCIVAGHYLPSGVGKLQIGWLMNEQIQYLLPTTYANGWIGFLDPKDINSITGMLGYGNWPMKLVTILAECGAIFFLWRHQTVKLFLVVWILFHLGIFLVSGICFWPWVLIELTLLALAIKKPFLQPSQFNILYFVLSIALIASSSFWIKGVALSWIDSPTTYTYRVAVIDENGERTELPPHFMAPYDYQFTLSDFHYLSDDKILPVTWGATDLQTFRHLAQVKTVKELKDIESEIGASEYRADKAERLKEFLAVYFDSLNDGRRKRLVPSWLSAPKMLRTFSEHEFDPQGSKVVRVEVHQVFSAFLDGKYYEVRRRPVLELDLD